MLVKFLGDLHGEHSFIHYYSKDVIQIGDLDLQGYDWWSWQFSSLDRWIKAYGEDVIHYPYSRMEPPVEIGTRYFIDGNHDYFPALDTDADEPHFIRPLLVYIPRGYVSGKTMFIGGGDSIDRHVRIPQISWFSQEGFTYEQQNKILNYNGEIEVIISHDCPYSAAEYLLRKDGRRPFGLNSSKFLEEVWKKFRPSLWVHGHFHTHELFDLNDTKFVSLGISCWEELNIPLEPNFFEKEWDCRYKRDR